MFNTIDTVAGSLRARFLMVGDMIGYQSDPEHLMVFEGPSGVVKVASVPVVEYHGFAACMTFVALNELGGRAVLTISAEEFVPHFGREA